MEAVSIGADPFVIRCCMIIDTRQPSAAGLRLSRSSYTHDCQTETRRYELRKRADAMEETRRRITEAAVELHGKGRAGAHDDQRDRRARRRPAPDRLPPLPHRGRAPSPRARSRLRERPWPDPARWRRITDPAERLATAPRGALRLPRANEALWTNVVRDETLVDSVAADHHDLLGLPRRRRRGARRRLGRARRPPPRPARGDPPRGRLPHVAVARPRRRGQPRRGRGLASAMVTRAASR